MANDRPIFVVGCPRSGTTLLTLMLQAHPRIAIPGAETPFILTAWRKRHRFAELESEETRRQLARLLTAKERRVRELGLKPAAVEKEIVAGPPTLGSAVGIIFRAHARRLGKPRWGDKRPRHFEQADALLRLFPDAQIVHIVRDGRATVASLKRVPWFRRSTFEAMAMWSMAVHCADRDRRRLPADSFHVLRYEDLVADPRAELGRLCDFLGEDLDEAMLEPHRFASAVPSWKRWHANLSREVGAVERDAWRQTLEPWEVGLIETALRRKLVAHGYELTGEGARPRPDRLARYGKAIGSRRFRTYRRWLGERRQGRRATHPIAARLTSGQLAAAGLPADGPDSSLPA